MSKRKTKRNGKLAQIASEAADIIRAKSRWCQGYWGARPRPDSENELGPACLTDGCDPSHNYVEANSPAAVKWCVEGAIYKAAKGKGGFRLGQEVVDRLNDIVQNDPETRWDIAMDLNDDNGDASRVALVKYLRLLAKDLRKQAA